jgi:hypothetical protein
MTTAIPPQDVSPGLADQNTIDDETFQLMRANSKSYSRDAVHEINFPWI